MIMAQFVSFGLSGAKLKETSPVMAHKNPKML